MSVIYVALSFIGSDNVVLRRLVSVSSALALVSNLGRCFLVAST